MTVRYSVLRRMRPRDPNEPHRVATPLELLFDLTFVVAVARASAALAGAITENELHHVVGYLMVFFAIWWAWMNFTWFASAYDCDDAAYRVLALLQMAGVLVLAAGVDEAFADEDFKTVTLGYVLMRIAMVIQWLRAAAADPERRNTNLGYAAGIFVVQLGWVARLALPDAIAFPAFFVLVAAELAVPWLTEQQGMTPWHPRHVAERYGLFTIIVLGECVTAASGALRGLFQFGGVTVDLVLLSVGGLLLLFGMWWIYFLHDTGEALGERRHLSFVWGYSHYLVFASAAAVGAGLEAASELTLLDALHVHGEEAAHAANGRTAALAIAVAVSVFLLLTSYVHTSLTDGHLPAVPETAVAAVALVAIGLILGNASLPFTVLAQGLVVALLVASAVLRDTAEEETP
ncbi:MAG TPA: low temperature requirement protein A [Nocardioidaceae bacterium]|nr:low temperature requirement protein A [Nocardioidaceae bacterium]